MNARSDTRVRALMPTLLTAVFITAIAFLGRTDAAIKTPENQTDHPIPDPPNYIDSLLIRWEVGERAARPDNRPSDAEWSGCQPDVERNGLESRTDVLRDTISAPFEYDKHNVGNCPRHTAAAPSPAAKRASP